MRNCLKVYVPTSLSWFCGTSWEKNFISTGVGDWGESCNKSRFTGYIPRGDWLWPGAAELWTLPLKFASTRRQRHRRMWVWAFSQEKGALNTSAYVSPRGSLVGGGRGGGEAAAVKYSLCGETWSSQNLGCRGKPGWHTTVGPQVPRYRGLSISLWCLGLGRGCKDRASQSCASQREETGWTDSVEEWWALEKLGMRHRADRGSYSIWCSKNTGRPQS